MNQDAIPAKRTQLVIGPNASLSRSNALHFFAGITVVVLGVAGWFTLWGFWPVLIFAGINLIALAVALTVCLRRNDYREVLAFHGDQIHVEFGFVGRGIAFRRALPLQTTRALIEQGPYRTSPRRLILSCFDQRIEIGHSLTDEERLALCHRVRELLHPGWERPVQRLPEVPSVAPWQY